MKLCIIYRFEPAFFRIRKIKIQNLLLYDEKQVKVNIKQQNHYLYDI